jgi:beta-1,4-mannosyl-glycoprotein beta-1,4-N-acetylglucosaminyltransferase
VDRFLLVESPVTHSGNPKPLFFKENEGRFAEWLPKITALVVDLPDAGHWGRERAQRDAVLAAVAARAAPEDVVILSDCDEVVSAEAIRELADTELPCQFVFPMHVYRLNWRWTTPSEPHFQICRADRQSSFGTRTFKPKVVKGWHFAYMGGEERITYKLQSFCHEELNTPAHHNLAVEAAAYGRDVFGRKDREVERCPDDEMPACVTRGRFGALLA